MRHGGAAVSVHSATMAGGHQYKRLKQQAEKDKEDAARALEAKKRRIEKERELAFEEAKLNAAKKKLEFEKDKAAASYYEESAGPNDRGGPGRPRSKSAALPGSGSRGSSGRASAAPPKSKSSANVEKENIPPEGGEQYPGWNRGDGHVGEDLDERAVPFVERQKDDEDRRSGSGGEESGSSGSEDGEDERIRTSLARRGPRHEPEQPLALATAGQSLSRMISNVAV